MKIRRRSRKPRHDRETASRRRRTLKLVAVVLALVAVALLLAPTIVTRTALLNNLLARLVPTGSASISSMRFGWLTPLYVNDLEVRDDHGQTWLTAREIAGDRTLWQVIRNPSDLGKLSVSEPNIQLKLRDDGSNLEDVTAGWLKSDSTSQGTAAVQLAVEIRNGVAHVMQQETGVSWTVERLNGAFQLNPNVLDACQVGVSGLFSGSPCSLSLTSRLDTVTPEWPLGTVGSLSLRTDALALQPLGYFADRVGMPANVGGALTCQLNATWRPDQDADPYPEIDVGLNAQFDRFALSAPKLIGADSLNLSELRCESQIRIANGVVELRALEVNSDVGHVQLVTNVGLEELLAGDTRGIFLQAVATDAFTTSGSIDLASAARELPTLFRIRKGLVLARGQLGWNISTSQTEGLRRWSGTIRSQDLLATRAGRPIAWQFPLDASFTARYAQELVLEQLSVHSDFVQLAGQGSVRGGKIHCVADLQGLAEQLGQVVDLDQLQLRGNLEGVLQWKEQAQDRVAVESVVRLLKFELAQGDRVWRENNLNVTASGTSLLDGRVVQTIESAELNLVSGGDELQIRLTEPVPYIPTASSWHVSGDLRGSLANWVTRVRPLVDLPGWRVEGQVVAKATGRISPKHSELQSIDAELGQLIVEAEGVRVHEPLVRFNGQGTLDHEALSCRIPRLSLASGSLSVAGQNVAVETAPRLSVSGDLAYRGDLSRLLRQLPALSAATAAEIGGRTTGKVSLAVAQGMTRFRMDGELIGFRVGQSGPANGSGTTGQGAAAAPWQEQDVRLKIEGKYDSRDDTMELTRAEVAGASIRLTTQGSATHVTSQPNVDLNGQVDYDLESLLAQFGGDLRQHIDLKGRHGRAFRLQGPLLPEPSDGQGRVSQQLTGRFGVAWDAAELFAVEVGPGQLEAVLTEGRLQTDPLELDLGGGRLQLAPTLHLNTSPLWMTLPSGAVADQVRITPAMCKTWMRYIAPLLADATAAQGSFAISLGKAEVPLLQPLDAGVEGELMVHSATVGPGPLAQQFLEIAQQVKLLLGKGSSRIVDPSKSWVVLQPQRIKFQLADRRVYHEDFQMLIDDLIIRTRGSVGLDESLSIVAEIPVLDEWIAREPVLAPLRGQILSVPVGGTVSRPRLDQRALTHLSGQLARRTAEGFLREELGNQLQKQLNRLFE